MSDLLAACIDEAYLIKCPNSFITLLYSFHNSENFCFFPYFILAILAHTNSIKV